MSGNPGEPRFLRRVSAAREIEEQARQRWSIVAALALLAASAGAAAAAPAAMTGVVTRVNHDGLQTEILNTGPIGPGRDDLRIQR